MATSSQAKAVGGVGAILVMLSFVPNVGAILGIVGFVMVLVGVKYIADDLKQGMIFNNMMIAVILSIAGIVVGSLIALPAVLNAFANGYFSGTNFAPSPAVTMNQWIAFGTAIGVGLFVAWAFFLASAVFLRRSYSTIGSRLNISMFRTAGLLYLIGAALTIVGIGFALLFVAQILTAIAFFSIQEQPQPQQRIPPPSEGPTLPPNP